MSGFFNRNKKEKKYLTLYFIPIEEVDDIDRRIKELNYSSAFIKHKITSINEELKQEYSSIENNTNPHAIAYILWGRYKDKEKFYQRETNSSTKYCSLCAQT